MSDVKVAEQPPQEPQTPPEAPAPPPTPEEIATPEILEQIIKGYNPDCDLVDFEAKLGTQTGENYMSIMYAVKMNLKNRKTGESDSLSVMLKTMPRNIFRAQMINDCGAFIKDAKMYTEIFPEFVKFQKEKGLKDEEIFRSWPACYATFHDGQTDYLGMEDLRVSGKFRLANRKKGMDMAHSTLVMKSIAQFHALSFAKFGGDYDQIMETYPFLEEKMFLEPEKVQEPSKMFFNSSIKNMADSLKKEGFLEEGELAESMIGDHFYAELHRLAGSKTKNAVIAHGDCWTNNMMFTYPEGSDTPTSLKFVDFQLSRCSSRCIDLNYFLYTSPHFQILNEKEQELLKVYHDEFNSVVTRLGVDTSEHDLSWESFQKEFDDCRFYGVVMGIMLAPMISAESDQIPDMENIKEEDFTAEGAEGFMNQLMGDACLQKLINIGTKHLKRVRVIVDRKGSK